MTRLVLVNAGKNYEYGVHEPINLLCLAAYAKKFGHEVFIADQLAGENVFRKIKKLNPDFVGITGTTAVITDAYEIADWCRKEKYKVILGGVHVSVMPEEALRHGDFVVAGEGEDALIKILEGKAKKGIVTGKVIEDLDSLPKIDRSMINMRYYQAGKDRNPGSHLHFVPSNTKLNSMLSTRGCPYNCIFCHNSWRGLRVRINSAKHIIEEMKDLKEKYGTEAIFFMDDDLLFNKKRVYEFCELYKKEKLNIIWGCSASVNSVDEEILRAIKEINCKQIMFGLESGNERILKMLKNGIATIEKNKSAILLAKKVGIFATGNFMIGNPTETEVEVMDSKRFIIENDLEGFGVTISTPLPGTKLWDMFKEQGAIPKDIDWRKFNTNKLTFNLSKISNERLDELWREFLNLTLERNAQTSPKRLLKVALKHPDKAIRRFIYNPKSVLVLVKKMFKQKYEKNKNN
ncbi:MAG: radical SAM protein [Nanoarchaeota archaeon]|nr:radical SAM protein [Nanoarchaeota archaeon]